MSIPLRLQFRKRSLSVHHLLFSHFYILLLNRIVFVALESTVYNGHIEYVSFDNKTEAPWKFYRSIGEVHNRSKNASNMASSAKFLLIPGPVNVGLCVNSSSETIRSVPTASCLSTGSCSDGSTLSLWILLPPVLNWTTMGNVTLMKYGKLEISCGLVNDRRNGTTKPIPSLMFSVAQSGEKCLWVSMIYGSMVTNAWTHIVVTIDATNSLRVYYNGQENDVKKTSCQSHASQGVFAFSSGLLPFTCMDELVLWNHVLLPEVVEYIYNATTFGGGCLLIFCCMLLQFLVMNCMLLLNIVTLHSTDICFDFFLILAVHCHFFHKFRLMSLLIVKIYCIIINLSASCYLALHCKGSGLCRKNLGTDGVAYLMCPLE